MRPRKSASVLTDYKVLVPLLFPFRLRYHCSIAAVKNPCAVIRALCPAMPLASPASTMSISLSFGSSSLIAKIGLVPSWVAIMNDSVTGAWCRPCSTYFDRASRGEVSLGGQFECRYSNSGVSLLICIATTKLFCRFCVLTSAKRLRDLTQLCGFRSVFPLADAPTLLSQSWNAGSLVVGSIRCQKLITSVFFLIDVAIVDFFFYLCLP
jgi:hypothetical protein